MSQLPQIPHDHPASANRRCSCGWVVPPTEDRRAGRWLLASHHSREHDTVEVVLPDRLGRHLATVVAAAAGEIGRFNPAGEYDLLVASRLLASGYLTGRASDHTIPRPLGHLILAVIDENAAGATRSVTQGTIDQLLRVGDEMFVALSESDGRAVTTPSSHAAYVNRTVDYDHLTELLRSLEEVVARPLLILAPNSDLASEPFATVGMVEEMLALPAEISSVVVQARSALSIVACYVTPQPVITPASLDGACELLLDLQLASLRASRIASVLNDMGSDLESWASRSAAKIRQFIESIVEPASALVKLVDAEPATGRGR